MPQVVTQYPLYLITAQAVPGKSGVILMARIVGYMGELAVQSSFSLITYAVEDLTNAALLGSGTLVIANVVYNALQQGNLLWTKDDAFNLGRDGRWGYNFATILPATLFTGPNSGDRNRADVQFTPVLNPAFPGSDNPFVVSWEWASQKVSV